MIHWLIWLVGQKTPGCARAARQVLKMAFIIARELVVNPASQGVSAQSSLFRQQLGRQTTIGGLMIRARPKRRGQGETADKMIADRLFQDRPDCFEAPRDFNFTASPGVINQSGSRFCASSILISSSEVHAALRRGRSALAL